jgi:hypothetical protein
MDRLIPGAKHNRFIFVYGGTSYVIWMWRGLYGGFGNGGEIAIYDQASAVPNPGGHWHSNPNDPNLPLMTESVSVNGSDVASFAPSKPQLWVASFHPGDFDFNRDDLKLRATVTFPNATMYGAFMKSTDVMGSGWSADPTTPNTATIKGW